MITVSKLCAVPLLFTPVFKGVISSTGAAAAQAAIHILIKLPNCLLLPAGAETGADELLFTSSLWLGSRFPPGPSLFSMCKLLCLRSRVAVVVAQFRLGSIRC